MVAISELTIFLKETKLVLNHQMTRYFNYIKKTMYKNENLSIEPPMNLKPVLSFLAL